jgi:hypothetical protein
VGARTYARIGKRDQAKQMLALRQTSRPAWMTLATAYAALGEKDEAFRLLDKLAEERNSLNYVKTDPRLDSLHSDPRWPLLLDRMNFPKDADGNTAAQPH